MIRLRANAVLILIIIFSSFFAACVDEDFTPVYFPPNEAEEAKGPSTSENVGKRQCTLEFTSELCVTIKGQNIEAGTDPDKPLCTEVPPFPIHIEGETATLNGSEFPDINFEGAGLPVPITINGKGNSDGSSNIATGDASASGGITLKDFSLFIVAVGVVGEVPNLTLTTGSTGELEHLQSISGSPPDAAGAMTLVTGTTLGSVIPAADKYLLGASLTAKFTGQITPNFSECGGETETTIEVKRLVATESGSEAETPVPDGNVLEISNGTYISETELDVGDHYESSAKFRITNTGSSPENINIPAKKGPFYISTTGPLARTLKPQESFSIRVTFRPTASDATPGTVKESIPLGSAQATLLAVALSKSGNGSVDLVDDEGNVLRPDVDKFEIGDFALPANTQKSFFLCKEISCNGSRAFTDCKECADPTTEPCELLPVSTSGSPIGEVDGNCKLKNADATPLFTIDLKGPASVSIGAKKQVIAFRNKGTRDMTITYVSVEDKKDSKSLGEFSIPTGAMFLADSFVDISKKVENALSGGKSQGSTFPITLPPYEPGFRETTLYVVVTYEPNDLTGSDGQVAGVGSKVKDSAVLKIMTEKGNILTEIVGTTTIQEFPALEIYFKTSSGAKFITQGRTFPFKGVTPDTLDLAVPLFLRASETAQNAIRVTSITISGEDSSQFSLLDTAEKINAIQPPSGKGFRCSIPVIDSQTGDMIDESFDLKPVSITPNGFDLAPGAHSVETMPLFGCVNFHRDAASNFKKRIFKATLGIKTQELDATGNPARNQDGSFRETNSSIELAAAINPLSGLLIFRVTQTMAAILNPNFPGLSSIDARADIEDQIAKGQIKDYDLQVFTGAMVLDPFDEMTIKSSDGKEVVSTPNDGVTAIFRRVDTHPTTNEYENEFLYDFASPIYDSLLPAGSRGIYEDYPNIPEGTKMNGWRIFTASLSYPGPIPPPGVPSPRQPSYCEVINPCDPDDLKKFTKGGVGSGGKGACAFFYASGGRFDSPAFHTEEEMAGGEYNNLCESINKPQTLFDVNSGRYSVDGRIEFEEVGLRFFGPTYFHNPQGPLGNYPPMDEVFHMGFTTGVIKPPATEYDLNILPDQKINLAKGEYKLNLDDPRHPNPALCKNNVDNRLVMGKRTSSWRFFKGQLFKDEEATIEAGCPEDDNEYTGGTAFVSGKNLDHETGNVSFTTAAKFSSNENLSFAFKDVMLFVMLNGWLCDPTGKEESFEGPRCYDLEFNDRDAASQKSLLDD